MYRRILVAIGDQPWLGAAVGYSIGLAVHTGAELHFLRVLSLPHLIGTPDTTPGSALIVDSVIAYSETTLSWVVQAAEEAGVSYTTTMRWGRIADTILCTAETEDCDLIVVGKGRPGWQSILRGSIARRVAGQARQPVLVVQQPPSCPDDMIVWSRALVVTDGSPNVDMTMQYALTLAQADDLDVLLLHVKAAWSPGEMQQGKIRAKDVCTLAAAQAAAAGVSYDVQMASGRAVPAILQTAAQAQCDVIILGVPAGTYWQQFWDSHMTRAVLAEAPCPVLLVPALPGLPTPVDSESPALRPHPKVSMSRLLSGSWKFPKKS